MSQNKQYKIKSFSWDDHNDARLKQLRAMETPIGNIAKVLGCSKGIVQRRLRVLNLADIIWTSAQDQFLRQHYETKTKKELAGMLKVDEMAVKDRCSFLGLLCQRGPKAKK